MLKNDLTCGYCGCKEFIEHPDFKYPTKSEWSQWECCWCHALFEDNPGYGYFTVDLGCNPEGIKEKYSLNTGELLDNLKLPRTPEGIVRHCGSKEELKKYLARTQKK